MMKNLLGAVLATALCLAPLPALAQQQATPAQPTRGARATDGFHGGSRSFGFLVQHRAELGLTDAQVEQLDAIAERLNEKNRPLMEQLRAAGVPAERARRGDFREMTPEQREAMRARLEANRPTLRQLRENAHAAMEEARAVLTPEQLEKMHDLMRERRKDGHGEQPRGKREGQRPARSGA